MDCLNCTVSTLHDYVQNLAFHAVCQLIMGYTIKVGIPPSLLTVKTQAHSIQICDNFNFNLFRLQHFKTERSVRQGRCNPSMMFRFERF